MEQFQNLSVNGIPILVLVIGIVQAVKKLGVSGNVMTFIAMILGTALAVGSKVAELDPQFRMVFDVIVFGLGGGVAATGVYDLINERLPKVISPKPVVYKTLQD